MPHHRPTGGASPTALLWILLSYAALAACSEGAAEVDLTPFPYAFDLAAGLAGAQLLVETRLIDLGTPAGHDFQLAGWADDGVFADDGSTFAWSLGEGSTLQLVVVEPRDLRVEARLRPYRIDGPPQKVRLELNGREVKVLTLKGGMRTYRFELPAGAVVRGRNELRLTNVYPERIGPGPPDLGPPGTAWDYLRFAGGEPVAAPAADGDVLFLPFGSAVSYFVEAAGAGLLTAGGLESSRRRGRLEVRLRRAGDPADRVERRLRASARRLAVAFDVGEPSLVGVTLAAVGGRPGDGGLHLRAPQLRSAAEVTAEARRIHAAPGPPAAAPAAAPPAGAGKRRPNVVVYLVDTLRADHLGCYGYGRATSPRIDAFAADAVVFANALAQSSWTRSSVASLMTGRRPPSHGVHGRDDALSPEAVTLAEVLRRAGYATAAFVTNGNVGRSFGFAQGFDVFEQLTENKGTAALHALSDEVNRRLLAWLDAFPGAPAFFLYVHTMEPHAPYAPPPPAARALAPRVRRPALDASSMAALKALQKRTEGRFGSLAARPELGSVTWLQGLRRGLIPVTPEMTEDLVALYDAEILFNDLHFGVLLDELDRRGLADDTVVVFLSDHGEEFYEHQGWEHGVTLYQEQLRVPLIVRFPDLPRGLRLTSPARHTDLLPTLADYLALPLPAGVEGASLLPEISEVDGAPRAVYSHLDLDGRFAESLVEGSMKLLCEDRAGIGCQLFDLAADPGERVDLAARQPVTAGYLRQRMRLLRRPEGGLEAEEAVLDEETKARLRALGYL